MTAALGAVGLVLTAAWVPLTYLTGDLQASRDGAALVFAVVCGLLGMLVARRQPRNPEGWLLLGGAVCAMAVLDSGLYAVLGYRIHRGGLPLGEIAVLLKSAIGPPLIFVIALVILLFPDGRLTRRWTWVLWAYLALVVVVTVGLVAGEAGAIAGRHLQVDVNGAYSGSGSPSGFLAGLTAVTGPGLLLFPLFWLAFAARQALSWRRSTGERRQQLKWLTSGAVVALAGIALIVAGPPKDQVSGRVARDLAFLALTALPVSIGVGILKYHLYDIDRLISKAVLYGSLIAFITAVYAGLVVGVGTLVGNPHSPLLTALAAAVVAVAFLPVRQRAGQLANRVVYGRRATPYQVLSQFARRIGGTYSAEEVLPQMAHIVAAGTGAEQVVVWLRVDDELRPEASSGGEVGAGPLPVDGQALPSLPGADLSVPVVHQGHLLGAISARMPKDEPLRPAGAELVADVASQAGLVLANTGLIEDLRASRQRLVTAQDEARRRLERNLHDGAQQDLVALGIKLNLAEITVAEDPAQAGQVFGELKAEAAGALENLRDLARGIYPPLLADLGLAAALGAQAGKSPLPLVVEADGIGRFGQDTEAAVYFCCLEALQNTAKYAHATQARICLRAANGTLSFTVSDDGAGYDTRHTPMGSGLRNMADRLAALGGRLEVQSAPGQGTTITGRLPVPATSGGH
jgi:signal transduction histidine kinase